MHACNCKFAHIFIEAHKISGKWQAGQLNYSHQLLGSYCHLFLLLCNIFSISSEFFFSTLQQRLSQHMSIFYCKNTRTHRHKLIQNVWQDSKTVVLFTNMYVYTYAHIHTYTIYIIALLLSFQLGSLPSNVDSVRTLKDAT